MSGLAVLLGKEIVSSVGYFYSIYWELRGHGDLAYVSIGGGGDDRGLSLRKMASDCSKTFTLRF